MSVAVAVIIRPSRMLNILMHAMCILVCFAGVLLVYQEYSQLSFGARIVVSLACFSGVIFALLVGREKRGLYRVEVDVGGKIYLHQLDAENCDVQRGCPVQLQPSSTLWPGMMVLRFRMLEGARQTIALTILRDSLSHQEFRALSASLRWVVAHRSRQDATGARIGRLQ